MTKDRGRKKIWKSRTQIHYFFVPVLIGARTYKNLFIYEFILFISFSFLLVLFCGIMFTSDIFFRLLFASLRFASFRLANLYSVTFIMLHDYWLTKTFRKSMDHKIEWIEWERESMDTKENQCKSDKYYKLCSGCRLSASFRSCLNK